MHRYGTEDDLEPVFVLGKKVMLVIGEHRPFDVQVHRLIDDFCNRWGAVVYANLLSNFHSEYCVITNMLMSSLNTEMFGKMAPDVVITIGGQTGDYPLYKMLSKPEFSAIEHWRVSEDGNVVDTYDKLTKDFSSARNATFLKKHVTARMNKSVIMMHISNSGLGYFQILRLMFKFHFPMLPLHNICHRVFLLEALFSSLFSIAYVYGIFLIMRIL